ncbi:MAG: TolC family protein [Puniceicoccales bacterium]
MPHLLKTYSTCIAHLFITMGATSWGQADNPIAPATIPVAPMAVEPVPSDQSNDIGLQELESWNLKPASADPAYDGLGASIDILAIIGESPLAMDIDASGPARALTLRESIDLALEKNLGLNIARFRPGFAQDQLTISESIFDPTIGASLTANESADPPASGLSGVTNGQSINAGQRFNLSVGKLFSTGTEVAVETRLNRSTTNSSFALLNPDYSTRLGVSVRQPLLAGFGEAVNLAAVAQAEIGIRRSRLEVRREVLDLVADVEVNYWNLAAARQRQALFLSNLRLAKSLLDENLARRDAGLATLLDVLQAEASLAARSEEVILAQEAADNAEDALRATLGILYADTAQPLSVETLPENVPNLPAFRESVQGALASDMESQIQLEILEQLEIARMVANNNTLPDLDIFGGAGVLGREGDGARAYQSAFEGRGYDWNVGLELSLPWGQRADEARLRSSVRSIYQAEAQLAEIQQELLRRLRLAWRSIASGRERLATTEASLRLNRESFEQERARYDAGLSEFRNVLEAQRDYDDAKLRHLSALFDLRQAVVLLARLDGRLLSRHGFTWNEIDARTQIAPEPARPLSQDKWPAPELNRFNRDPDTLPASYGHLPSAFNETFFSDEPAQQ